MLRLRLPEALPSTAIDGQELKFPVWACNESGSLIALSRHVPLSVELLSGVTLSPIDRTSASLTLSSAAVIGLDGFGQIDVKLACRGEISCRIRISAKSTAPCLPLRREGRSASTAAVTEIPVCAVTTTAFELRRGVALADAADRRATVAEANSVNSATCQVVSVELGSATLGAVKSATARSLCLRLFEQQMKVGPGFGSIVWDCAIATSALLNHLATSACGSSAYGHSSAEAGGRKAIKRATASAAPTDAERIGAEASHLLRTFRWPGSRVLDLGTGTGIVGITAACMGARVLLTDLPQLLPLTALNIHANAAAIREGGGDAVTAPLVWGDLAYFDSASPPPSAADKAAGAVAAGTTFSRGHKVTLPLFVPVAELSASISLSAVGGADELKLSAAAAASAAGGPIEGADGGDGDGMPAFPRGSAAHPAVHLLPPYDVILASEVAYRTEVFPLLLATLRGLTRVSPALEVAASAAVGAATPSTTSASRAAAGAAGAGRSTPFVLLAARKRACCELEEFIGVLAESFHVVQLVGDALPASAAGGPSAGGAGSGAAAAAGGAGGAKPAAAGSAGKGGKPAAASAATGSGCAAAASGAPAAAPSKFCDAVEATAHVLPAPVASMIAKAQALSKTAYAPMIFMLLPVPR